MYDSKWLPTLLFFLLFTVYSSAQNFKGGITGGVLASQIDGDFLGGYNKPGLTFGGWVGHELFDDLTMYGEIRYIQKGKSKIPDQELGIIGETTRLNYLQLPLMTQYNLQTHWFIEGGLGIGYLFGYSFYEGGTKLNEEDYPITDDEFYTLEFCFLIGAGYHFSDQLSLHLRFTNDIFPIADLTDAAGTNPWIDPGNLYNKTLELTLSYAFEL